MKSDKSQELAKLIGRRLREACEGNAAGEFPATIAAGLAKLQQTEDLYVAGAGGDASTDANTQGRQTGKQIAVADAACEASGNGVVDANT